MKSKRSKDKGCVLFLEAEVNEKSAVVKILSFPIIVPKFGPSLISKNVFLTTYTRLMILPGKKPSSFFMGGREEKKSQTVSIIHFFSLRDYATIV